MHTMPEMTGIKDNLGGLRKRRKREVRVERAVVELKILFYVLAYVLHEVAMRTKCGVTTEKVIL